MKPHSSYVQKKLIHQVVQYIVSHSQPIYLVEFDDFKHLIKSFDTWFKMPYVSTIKTIIFDFYSSVVKQIIDFILETSDTISLTFDIWSSRAHDSYIRITCYWLTESFESHKIILEIGELNNHYASDIVESVNSIFDKFNINHQKIFSITTDNGANAKPTFMQLYSTLNKHTLREVRKSAKMLGSFLSSEEEFELLEELVVILSPFDEATQFLSGSKYSTLGFMIPILEELARQLKYFTGQNKEANSVSNTILDNLIER
ncbi:16116_t:CDS:2 [Gigaspora rosea]|nr:16116_t:CDS:2 [Gigaspora rosea]